MSTDFILIGMNNIERDSASSSENSLPWEETGAFSLWKSSNVPNRLGTNKNSLAWWKRLPSLLNIWQYHKQLSMESDTLTYEPIHLHVSMQSAPASVAGIEAREGEPGTIQVLNQTLTPEHFRFLLEQIPAIRTLSFSGPPDPFQNPHLMQLVGMAYKFNQAESTIFTDGQRLQRWIDPILQSPLAYLVVKLEAHKPSEYWRLSGRPPAEFVQAQEQLKALLERRKLSKSSLVIDICLTVDIHNFRNMPQMLAYAQELGVDGVRFENYLSSGQGSDRTLYRQQKAVSKFMKQMQTEKLLVSPLHVSLPPLLDMDMSQHRHCREGYTTVSVDVDFNLSPCSRHLATPVNPGKIWDSDFWNNDMYQWLRSIHGTYPGDLAPSATQPPVPDLCRHCPMNMPRNKRPTNKD
jgi:hypothetical protein